MTAIFPPAGTKMCVLRACTMHTLASSSRSIRAVLIASPSSTYDVVEVFSPIPC